MIEMNPEDMEIELKIRFKKEFHKEIDKFMSEEDISDFIILMKGMVIEMFNHYILIKKGLDNIENGGMYV